MDDCTKKQTHIREQKKGQLSYKGIREYNSVIERCWDREIEQNLNSGANTYFFFCVW